MSSSSIPNGTSSAESRKFTAITPKKQPRVRQDPPPLPPSPSPSSNTPPPNLGQGVARVTSTPPPEPRQDQPATTNHLVDVAQNDAKRYGDNPYRIDNLVDHTNRTVFLDHLGFFKVGGYGGFFHNESRMGYWEAVAKQCGTVSDFYWNEESSFAIVTMSSHEEARVLFRRVGDKPWDYVVDEYSRFMRSGEFVKQPFARWRRPKGTCQLVHRKPGSSPQYYDFRPVATAVAAASASATSTTTLVPPPQQ